MLQFISIFDVALNQNGESKHSSVIILQAHHNIAELLLSPQIIEGWLFDKGVREFLDEFGADDCRLILEVDYQRVVGLFFAR